jgi:hypothetical protein
MLSGKKEEEEKDGERELAGYYLKFGGSASRPKGKKKEK